MSRSNLLLLHWALRSRSQFCSMMAYLKDQYELHSLDFEGHGSSPSRGRPFRVKYFGENALDYFHERTISMVDILGYNLGGHVSLYLARFFPERVNRIFALGSSSYGVWRLPNGKMLSCVPGEDARKGA